MFVSGNRCFFCFFLFWKRSVVMIARALLVGVGSIGGLATPPNTLLARALRSVWIRIQRLLVRGGHDYTCSIDICDWDQDLIGPISRTWSLDFLNLTKATLCWEGVSHQGLSQNSMRAGGTLYNCCTLLHWIVWFITTQGVDRPSGISTPRVVIKTLFIGGVCNCCLIIV